VPELDPVTWAVVASAAFLVGFAKTGIGGVAALSVAAFAFVFPARESTGALLPLLLVGDVIAVAAYRRHTDWSLLLRLLPAVAPGIVLGACFMAGVAESTMQRVIAMVLLGMAALHAVPRVTGRALFQVHAPHDAAHWALAAIAGLTAGFATMTANAAGPVMTLYLLLAGLPVLGLLGTAAWFFLIVNAAKVPFSTHLDLISVPVLLMDLALVPALALGAVAGRFVVGRIRRQQFEDVALSMSVVTAVALLL
jgi:uncharacterized membrane protein YfcA